MEMENDNDREEAEQAAQPEAPGKGAGWLAFWMFGFPLVLIIVLAALGVFRAG